MAGAIFWYDEGIISQHKAAAIAGLDRTHFLFALAHARVDVFQRSAETLNGELELGLQAHRERLAARLPDESGTS